MRLLAPPGAGSDFEGLTERLIVPECARRVCVNITLIDDAVVEDIEEFSVTLQKGLNYALNDQIIYFNREASCVIIDSDSKIFHIYKYQILYFCIQMLVSVLRLHFLELQKVTQE